MYNNVFILDFNRTLYNPDNGTLIDGSIELLRKCKKEGIVILVCKKENGREDLIESLGIKSFFQKIVITEKKTPEQFLDIKKEFPSKRYVAVGDRLQEELRCAKDAGMETVWFCFGKFAEETPKKTGIVPTRTIFTLSDF